MLRTLVFGAIAAIAGRQLYKSGALDRFSEDLRTRGEQLKAKLDESAAKARAARPASPPIS